MMAGPTSEAYNAHSSSSTGMKSLGCSFERRRAHQMPTPRASPTPTAIKPNASRELSVACRTLLVMKSTPLRTNVQPCGPQRICSRTPTW